MKKVFFNILLLTVVISGKIYSQILTGEWREHLPYNNVVELEIVGDRVYCATTSALFYYDKEDGSINRKSKINGLSDLGVGSIAYCEKNETLIIGYESGNIDLIKDDKVYNLPDIKEKVIIADKTIRDISIFGDIAYVSLGFGVVELNVEKREIADTYIIGEGGSYLGVSYVGVVNDSIYALTDEGILKSNVDNLFLSYYGSWDRDTILSGWDTAFISGAVIDNDLYVVSSGDSTQVSVLSNSKWSVFSDYYSNIKSLSSSNNNLLVTRISEVLTFDQLGNIINKIRLNNLSYSLIDSDGNYYIASTTDGLFFDIGGGEYKGHFPDGPIFSVFSLKPNGNQIISTYGGYRSTGSNLYQKPGFSSMSDELQKWTNYSRDEYPIMYDMRDVSSIGSTGIEGDYYLGTWGYGLIEVNGNEVVNIYNEDNTEGVLITEKSQVCGISDITYDKQGNLWMVQRNLEAPFFIKTNDGNWYNYNYGSIMVKTLTGNMINTANNDIWVMSASGGEIGVINSNGTIDDKSDDEWNSFSFIDNDGKLISTKLLCIAEDHDGAIWIGSENGVGVYDKPSDVINDRDPRARLPQVEVDGFLHSLLEGEVVTSVVVDGANRKWFGTAGGGLFLVSADGTEQIIKYSESDDHLFSDDIKTLAMNPRNGELFIGTDKGIQSYMTSSSASRSEFSDVYAFPNPVPPDYSGFITVRGLMYESVVKITDVSGNIVYENESNGGDFVWNGKDMSGNTVRSGLYVVMCATPDGEDAEVTKILFVK